MTGFIIGFIAIVIIAAIAVFLENRQKNVNLEKSSNQYNFKPTNQYGDFYIDNSSMRWMVTYVQGTSRPYHIGEVIGWELVENGERYKSEGGVLRAVAGGALFGGVGAIVGATTANKVRTINHLAVNIYTSDINTPLVVVHCHAGSNIRSDSFQYSVACSTANDIMSALQALQFRYEQKSSTSPAKTSEDSPRFITDLPNDLEENDDAD